MTAASASASAFPLDLYRSFLHSGDLFVEIGTGPASVTLGMAALVGSTGHGIAIEPRILRRRALGAALAAGNAAHVRCPESSSAPIDSLDLVSCRLMRIGDVDAAAVLLGAGATLRRCRPVVAVACPSGEVPDHVLELVAAAGYACFWHAAGRLDAVEIIALAAGERLNLPRVAPGSRQWTPAAMAGADESLKRGNRLYLQGDRLGAEATYRDVVERFPDEPDGWHNLGVLLHATGRAAEAVDCLRTRTRLAPDDAEGFTALGGALRETGDLARAARCHRHALAVDPGLWSAAYNLGNSLHAAKQSQDAVTWYRRGIVLRQDQADLYHNLANALAACGNAEQAVPAFHLALQFDPRNADIWGNLAKSLQELNRLDEALVASNRGLSTRPDFVDLLYNRSLLLLLRGDYRTGWREYEWRWKCSRFTSPPLRQPRPRPQWKGEDLTGKRILVHAEQGLGDALQFLRYVPLVAAQAAEVQLLMPAELEGMVPPWPKVRLLHQGERFPDYDFHCPLLSLPALFDTERTTVPSPRGSVVVEESRRLFWSAFLGGKELRVGLVWAGNPKHANDANRSIDLERLRPLADIKGVQLYSLQVGDRAAELARSGLAGKVVDLTADLKSFSDTAAIMSALDLVIAVDTAPAHLAGVLGRPVWTLLPFAPDWRWMTGTDESPWYPSMRLFRQNRRSDWAPVIERCLGELRKLASKRPKRDTVATDKVLPRLVDLAAQAHQANQLDEARRRWARVARLAPMTAAAWHALSALAHHGGHPAAALDLGRRAAILAPDEPNFWSNLGVYEKRRGGLEKALAYQTRAVRLDPRMPESANNLASAASALGRPAIAAQASQRAIQIVPSMAEAWYNYGVAVKEDGRLDESLAALRRAQSLRAGYVEAKLHEALALLLAGDLVPGWESYESRWLQPDTKQKRDFAQPLWNGEPLGGRVIFLHAEQGFGDTLQFMRYVPLVAARGGRVLLGVQPELTSIASRLPGIWRIFHSGGELPHFDVHCPLLSLPRAFATRIDSVPADVPYVVAEPGRLARWQQRLAKLSGPRVGLVWAGRPTHKNDANRSIALARLLQGTALPAGASLVSLQKGEATAQLRQIADVPILDLEAELTDFEETAAVLSCLDCLITVDTAVAHLAGALGVKVLLLLPHAPDWRWILGRDDSPWYPSMRIFRQARRGDWGEALAALTEHLSVAAGEKASPSPHSSDRAVPRPDALSA